MSVEYHQNLLTSVQSHDPEFMQAAQSINELTEMCKEGNVSPQEYTELLRDIQRKLNIKQSMSELENLSKLNTAINGLISIAGAV
jgi:uncharacterized protein YdcH (DUF465 family)